VPSPFTGTFRTNGQQISGIVVSAKMNKTVVVQRERSVPHPKYRKSVTSAKKFYAHDEFNVAREGDYVQIVESRPLSKTKRWILQAILRYVVPRINRSRPSQDQPLVRVSLIGLKQDERGLCNGREYRITLGLERDQLALFAIDSSNRDHGDHSTPKEASTAPEKLPTQRPDYAKITITCPGLEITPAVVRLISINNRLSVEPNTLEAIAKFSGSFDLAVSVVGGHSGEVIQTQVFPILIV